MKFKESESGEFINAFAIASQVVIAAMVNSKKKYIVLAELHEILGANTRAEKTSVRMGVRHCKDAKLIKKIEGENGVYKVL